MNKIWKVGAIGRAEKIIDLYITKVDIDEDAEKNEKHYSQGGAFDAPSYQVVRCDNDEEFYGIVGKLFKNESNLSRDAKVNLNPYILKGKQLYPEFFV